MRIGNWGSANPSAILVQPSPSWGGLLIVERLLSLPQAAGDLLDDAASQNHWEAVVSALGVQTSFRSLVALAVIAVITLVSAVCAVLTIKTDGERFLIGSVVALASAFLVMIIWGSAPHQSSLAPLLGKPVEPPARIRIFQTALAAGKIEAGNGIDPSLFEGALWPLLFSRAKAHRRHVRARDGHRELNLLRRSNAELGAPSTRCPPLFMRTKGLQIWVSFQLDCATSLRLAAQWSAHGNCLAKIACPDSSFSVPVVSVMNERQV